MITTAVVTVGTSLFSTLEDLGRAPSGTVWMSGLGVEGVRRRLEDWGEAVDKLRRDVNRRDWDGAGETLAQLPADLPQWGAEVATLRALRNEPECRNLQHLLLLASDTDEGRGAAAVLTVALARWERLAVHARVVADLDPASPTRFKVDGLRNLVSALASATREAHPHTPVFVMSGGFKAQVALTAVVGQALGVPVAYRFEAFPDTIWLPPLPIRMDVTPLRPLLDLLQQGAVSETELRTRVGAPLTEANTAWATVRALLAPAPDSAYGHCWSLSPLGQLVLEMAKADES